MLNEKIIRPTSQAYFMKLCRDVATRSTCIRNHVGAILVRKRRILTTGYNGAPSGTVHCLDIGCARQGLPSGTYHELCRAVHAEQNAIIQAALHGIPTEGSSLFCTHQPCMLCAKMLINAGIIEVIYDIDYPDKKGLEILKEAGVIVEKFDPEAHPIDPNYDKEYWKRAGEVMPSGSFQEARLKIPEDLAKPRLNGAATLPKKGIPEDLKEDKIFREAVKGREETYKVVQEGRGYTGYPIVDLSEQMEAARRRAADEDRIEAALAACRECEECNVPDCDEEFCPGHPEEERMTGRYPYVQEPKDTQDFTSKSPLLIDSEEYNPEKGYTLVKAIRVFKGTKEGGQLINIRDEWERAKAAQKFIVTQMEVEPKKKEEEPGAIDIENVPLQVWYKREK
jgi:dCMP deaminase